jgi:hypothetical protein
LRAADVRLRSRLRLGISRLRRIRQRGCMPHDGVECLRREPWPSRVVAGADDGGGGDCGRASSLAAMVCGFLLSGLVVVVERR